VKLAALPCGVIDWTGLPTTMHAGETGSATMRSRQFGDIQLRLVGYGSGYLADHWCDKGHILFVVQGAVTIEHRDGRRSELAAGMTWHVADEGAPSHRVFSERGAQVFIVD